MRKQEKWQHIMISKNRKGIKIQQIHLTDIPQLQLFFKKAYGKTSIFVDSSFLENYFKLTSQNSQSNNLVAIINNDEIVSHYGGLNYSFRISNDVFSLVWGVSAYTLNEFRGLKLNSEILHLALKSNKINGVIGFTKETALFYQQLGYNVFDFKRFSRHLLILDLEKSIEISNYINNDGSKLKQSRKVSFKEIDSIIALTAKNIDQFDLKLHEEKNGVATTDRNKEFLKWRFLENPFIKYTLFAHIELNTIKAYIAIREEELSPFNYKACRIIDIFGDEEGVELLLHKAYHFSIEKKDIYIDFSMFGNLYKKQLNDFGFIQLEEDDCCILPQITAPIGNRDNYEYIGLYSNDLKVEINDLTCENVYFTRMDSDRDRLANISQINH